MLLSASALHPSAAAGSERSEVKEVEDMIIPCSCITDSKVDVAHFLLFQTLYNEFWRIPEAQSRGDSGRAVRLLTV